MDSPLPSSAWRDEITIRSPFESTILSVQTRGIAYDSGIQRRQGMAFDLNVNGTRHTIDADPVTPLLWVIRDYIGLTGTKFSCGIGQCGACTVHVDGQPVRSCSVRADMAAGKKIITIEGISPDGNHP